MKSRFDCALGHLYDSVIEDFAEQAEKVLTFVGRLAQHRPAAAESPIQVPEKQLGFLLQDAGCCQGSARSSLFLSRFVTEKVSATLLFQRGAQ
jgi:hypothetical protein